jgi:hypothetical protein
MEGRTEAARSVSETPHPLLRRHKGLRHPQPGASPVTLPGIAKVVCSGCGVTSIG